MTTGSRSGNDILKSAAVTKIDETDYAVDPGYLQHPDVIAHLRARSGETVTWESEWVGRVKACAAPLRGKNNLVYGVIGLAVDVSREDLEEGRRRSSESLLHAILEHGEESVTIMDKSGKQILTSAELSNLRQSSATGQDAQLVTPKDQSDSEQDSTPMPFREFEVRSLRSNQVDLLLRFNNVKRSNPATEIKRPDNSAAMDSYTLLEGLPHPVAVLDLDGLLKAVNTKFCHLIGLPEEHLLESNASTIFQDFDIQSINPLANRQGGGSFLISGRANKLKRANISLSITPGRDTVVLFVESCEDVLSWADSRLTLGKIGEPEKRILELLARGASNAQISEELHMSRQGLDYKLKTLRDKFRVDTRGALVAKAFTERLFSLEWPPRILDD
ncbi:helix-turn-helix transcriptional regulator [Streptomyces vinaceus]|uniref:helix-turn-helix transcriptional regulator n=1 Tax=Streptomyces vinaceus TaxID=1960 RepID=UPI0036A74B2A